MNRRCIIIGAGDLCGEISLCRGDFVIAADAGCEKAKEEGITPDLIIGDFDSLGRVPKGDNVIALPVAKDDTDMMYAVKTGLKLGYKEFLLYGGTGGRIDHTLANIQTLSYICLHGAIGYLFGDGFKITVIGNTRLRFKEHKGRISVFCAGGEARGVYLRGMEFPLTDATLTFDMPLGVSNAFKDEKAEVEVRDGLLAVYWEGNEDMPLPCTAE